MSSFLIFLAILIGSAIVNWLKKRGEAEQQQRQRQARPPQGASQPRGVRPGAPAKPTSWEEELRRLLEGDAPAAPPRPAPPPIRPVSPTVVVPPTPRVPTPSPLRPVVVQMPRVPAPPPIPSPIKPMVVRLPESSPMPTPLPVPTVTSIGTRDLASMEESRQAYVRASQLGQQVSAHIQSIPSQHVLPTQVLRQRFSPEAAQVVSMFRNARTARQAVVASIILGPPPGLGQGTTGY